MKKNIKLVIAFIIGAIVSGGVVYASTQIFANDVSYDNTTSGLTSTDVQGAIDELYDIAENISAELLWTNPSPDAAFSAQTINLDLSEYKYVIIVTKTGGGYDYTPRYMNLIRVPSPEMALYGQSTSHKGSVIVNTTGIEFGATTYSTPYKIYGLKNELGLDINTN